MCLRVYKSFKLEPCDLIALDDLCLHHCLNDQQTLHSVASKLKTQFFIKF